MQVALAMQVQGTHATLGTRTICAQHSNHLHHMRQAVESVVLCTNATCVTCALRKWCMFPALLAHVTLVHCATDSTAWCVWCKWLVCWAQMLQVPHVACVPLPPYTYLYRKSHLHTAQLLFSPGEQLVSFFHLIRTKINFANQKIALFYTYSNVQKYRNEQGQGIKKWLWSRYYPKKWKKH